MRFSAHAFVDLDALERVVERFPEMRSRYLGFTADKLKDLMKSQFLSGQEIMLKTSRDSLGRSMVNYRIANRGEKARLTSIPMNLFERGRMLRSGKKERGKWVVTRKVPKAAQPYVANRAREFEKVVLQELGS
jgi:hypothetical protein